MDVLSVVSSSITHCFVFPQHLLLAYSDLSSTLFAFFLIFEMDIQLIYLSSFFSKKIFYGYKYF